MAAHHRGYFGGYSMAGTLLRQSVQITVVIMAMAIVMSMLGCQPKTKSLLYPDRDVTGEEIIHEKRQIEDRIRREAEEDLQSEKLKADQARREFESALRMLDIETQAKVEGLRSAFESVAGSSEAAMQRIGRKLEVGLADINAKVTERERELQAKWDRLGQVAGIAEMAVNNPLVATFLGGFPFGAALISGVGWMRSSIGKQRDLAKAKEEAARAVAAEREARMAAVVEAEKAVRAAEHGAWDEATQAAEKQAAVRDATYDSGARESELSRLLGTFLTTALVAKSASVTGPGSTVVAG